MANDGLGTISGDSGEKTVRLERTLAAPPEEVWQALTEPAQLRAWLAPAEMDVREGGDVKIDFSGQPDGGAVHGVIRICDPPRTLEYEWMETGDKPSVVRFDLEPAAEGTKLTLTHRLLSDDEVIGFAAGWHAHLEALIEVARGASFSLERGAELHARYEALRPIYEAAHGALLP